MSEGVRTGRIDAAPANSLLLLVVASAMFISVLTGSVVNVVIPAIRTEFGASPARVGWVVASFALAYAVSVPLYGRVFDLGSGSLATAHRLRRARTGWSTAGCNPLFNHVNHSGVSHHPFAIL